MIRTTLAGAVTLACLMPFATASANEDYQAEIWASACFACHGPEGRSDGGMPTLAGLSADGMYRMLLDFRSGERRATVMHHHTRGYSEQQLRRIADILGEPSN